MRPAFALRSAHALDGRLFVLVALLSVAIALLALQSTVVAPRSLEPVQPLATPGTTALPFAPAAPAETIAPTVAPPSTFAPSAAPDASPGAPAPQVPSGGAPQDRTGSGGAIPQDRGGYGANGPAIVEPGGSRLITDDPAPPKTILPKGSMGQ